MKRINELHGSALRTQWYSAYGYLQKGSDAALGFNGERADKVLQGYALGNGHRLYSPALMRFFSPDKLSPFDAGGMNAYGYCKGDPVNLVDPTGQFAVSRLFGKAARNILNFLTGRAGTPAPLRYHSVQTIDVPASLRRHNLPASLESIVEHGLKTRVDVTIYQPAAENRVNVFTYDTVGLRHQRVTTRQEPQGVLYGFVADNVLVSAPGIHERVFWRVERGYAQGRYAQDQNGRWHLDINRVRRNAPQG